MIKVIAIDPGVTTGYAYGDIKEGNLKFHITQSRDEVWDLWDRLKKYTPDYVIIEDFEFRKGSQRGGLNLFPQQMIGVTRLYSVLTKNNRLFIQNAAQGKSYYTDNVLKQSNLYMRGIPHGTDASRHLLQWFTFGFGYQFASPSVKSGEGITMLETRGGEKIDN